MKIKGGYYIKARQIQDSEIAHSPPHFREIWDWLIKEANHKDRKTHGKIIKRGQCFRTYKDILEGLHWKVGYRKQRYKMSDCENAMKFLRSRVMITTTKAARGVIITILNYDRYQDPKSYESRNDNRNDNRSPTQHCRTKNKNGKNEKNDKKKERKDISAFPQITGEKAGSSEPFYLTKKKRKLKGFKLETFELFWNTFDYKKDKANAADAWYDIQDLNIKLVYEHILPGARRYRDARPAIIESKHTPKWAQGWISSRRWEDEKYEDEKDGLNEFLRRHGKAEKVVQQENLT